MTEPTELTDLTDLKERLERLARRGTDPGPEWLLASVRQAQAHADPDVTRPDAPRRRALVAVVVAFVAVVAITIAAIALGASNQSVAPPATTPKPTVVQPAPTNVATESVSAGGSQPALVSPSEGWICDQPLRHTVDGGKTWRSIPVPLPIDSGLGCEFLPGGRAWVGTGGNIVDRPPAVLRFVEGPHPSVTQVALPGTTPQETIASLAFTNDDHGWALTSLQLDKSHGYRNRNNLFVTVDGGLHWHLLAVDAPISGGLEFTSATRGWAVDGRVLRRTDDGGRTWSRVSVPLPPTISDAPSLISVFVFGDRIVVEGVRPEAKSPIVGTKFSVATVGDGFIDVSNDNNRTWSLRMITTSPDVFPLSHPPGLVAVDASHWRLYGYGVFATNDAGASWKNSGNALFNVTGAGSNGGMTFITPKLGWVTTCKTAPATPGTVPTHNPVCHPLVVRTTDGGRTWTRVAQL
jgi:photosystem II stability/assembly factor-like uncharacterized protein